MKCGYCGKNIKDDAKFCNYCGHNLREILSDEPSAPSSKGGYLSSLLTLLAILAILCAGGAYLLKNGGSSDVVSASDDSASSLTATQAGHAEVTHIDKTLIGQWHCLDPTAVGYSRSAYGIDVDIVLNIPDSSGFTLRYSVTDTGAPALNLKLSGTYSVKNDTITFHPDLTNASGDTGSNFFKNLSAATSFEYTVTQDALTLKSETGTDIIFNRVSA